MLKIIISGPESSGKTSLAKALSKDCKIEYTKEYARKYLTQIKKRYTKEDLSTIAKIQLENEISSSQKNEVSIHDTDLITIKIWSLYKYGDCENWILKELNKQKEENRVYLLCSPDIPWQSDPLRENPNDREELFKIYQTELSDLGHTYFIINGEERIEKAKKIIQKLIESC